MRKRDLEKFRNFIRGGISNYKPFSLEEEREFGRRRDSLRKRINEVESLAEDEEHRWAMQWDLESMRRFYRDLGQSFLSNNMNLVFNYTLNYWNRNSYLGADDAIDLALDLSSRMFSVWDGLWDWRKGKFSTYCIESFNTETIRWYNRKRREQRFVPSSFQKISSNSSDEGYDILSHLPDYRHQPIADCLLIDLLRGKAQVLLTKREAEVIRLTFGIGDNPELTFEEVGRMIGVTKQRVSQIRRRALRRLAELFTDGDLR